MRIEAKYDRRHIDQWFAENPNDFGFSCCMTHPYLQPIFIGYTATHGRVSATAPTMHEAIALCLNGVYQVKFIKN